MYQSLQSLLNKQRSDLVELYLFGDLFSPAGKKVFLDQVWRNEVPATVTQARIITRAVNDNYSNSARNTVVMQTLTRNPSNRAIWRNTETSRFHKRLRYNAWLSGMSCMVYSDTTYIKYNNNNNKYLVYNTIIL